MVADKHPPPKPEDVPEDVPEDDNGVDEEAEERQEAIRYNRILLQGSFLLYIFFFFVKKKCCYFLPPIYSLSLLANEEIDREIDIAVDDLDRLQQDIERHQQELYLQEEQLIAMIYYERAKRVALLSARHATLESETEKSDSGNGSGDCPGGTSKE